jgi:hypothetical protein
MSEFWFSIEVLDAEFSTDRLPMDRLSADQWREAYGAAMVEAAISHGAQDWNWHRARSGIVFEVAFTDWEQWLVYRELPVIRAALDAAPDPLNGVMIYPGRGGSSGSPVPRRPRPIAAGGAAPIPESVRPFEAPELIRRPELIAQQGPRSIGAYR